MTGSAPRAGRRPAWFSIPKAILAVGALAGAIGSIFGLGSTLVGWFDDKPIGNVEELKIQTIRPLTYGEWVEREGGSTRGMPTKKRAIPGKLIAFQINTSGYDENDELPVRIVVRDVTHSRSQTYPTDPARVKAGEDCGCADWVAIPKGSTRYYLEVAVYPPGPLRGDPLKNAISGYFGGASGGRRS